MSPYSTHSHVPCSLRASTIHSTPGSNQPLEPTQPIWFFVRGRALGYQNRACPSKRIRIGHCARGSGALSLDLGIFGAAARSASSLDGIKPAFSLSVKAFCGHGIGKEAQSIWRTVSIRVLMLGGWDPRGEFSTRHCAMGRRSRISTSGPLAPCRDGAACAPGNLHGELLLRARGVPSGADLW